MKRNGIVGLAVVILTGWVPAQISDAEFATSFLEDPFAIVKRMPARIPPASGLQFVVVDPFTSAPVAGASIVWCTRDKSRDRALAKVLLARLHSRQPSLLDLALATRFGQRYVSDPNGKVIVPGTRQAVAIAVHRGRTAWRGCWGNGGKLELGACRWLRVRVTTAAGKPAEGLLVQAVPRSCSSTPVPTGASGIALVPVPADARCSFRLVADVETKNPVEKKIQPAELETIRDPIDLKLPPTGAILVTVVDRHGNPRSDVYDIRLSNKPRPLIWDASRDRYVDSGRPPTKPKKTGGIYRHVGIGVGELHVLVRLKGVSGQLRGRGRGPTKPGTIAEIRVRDTGILEPKIQWPDGKPFAHQNVHIRVTPAAPPAPGFNRVFSGPHSLNISTDKNGLARFTVPTQEFEEGEKGSVSISYWKQENANSEPGLIGKALFDGRNPEVATIPLAEAPIAVAGIVVDESGKPMPRVYVHTNSSRRFTDADGRFELRGTGDRRIVNLQAQEPGHLRFTNQIPFGTADVRIVLGKAAKFEASFDGERPSLHYRPSLELVCDSRRQHLPLRRRIEWPFMPPGNYAFEIRLHNEVVHRIEGIELIAGKTCRDPRLQKIPWETFLRKVCIRVLDTNQQPLPHAKVTHWRPTESSAIGGERGKTDTSGKVTLWVPRRGANLLVETPGGRWMRLPSVKSDTTITATPKPTLLVELSEDYELPPGFRLEAWWQAGSQRTDPWHLPRYAFLRPQGFAVIAKKEARLPLPDKSEFKIEIRVRRTIDGKPDPKTEIVPSLTTSAHAEQGRVRLQCSTAAASGLRAAIHRLRSR